MQYLWQDQLFAKQNIILSNGAATSGKSVCAQNQLSPTGMVSNVLKEEYSNCGFQLLPLCNREVDAGNQSPIAWRRFEKVLAGKNRKGELKKVIRLEYKFTNTHTFLQYAMPKIQHFIWHQHVARWQDSEFKSCLANLGPIKSFP
jgi:hypothetical protein